MWRNTWINVYRDNSDLVREDLQLYGTALARIAEAHSMHSIAEEIFNMLAESADQRASWIAAPAPILITTGEFNRRRGNLSQAEERYNQAEAILVQDLNTTSTPQSIHKELGRLFYERAYIHHLRGDATATGASLERSDAECALAGDHVGEAIAQIQLAGLALQEGSTRAGIQTVTESLATLDRLIKDSNTHSTGRTGFARRWVINARTFLLRAKVVDRDLTTARSLLQVIQNDQLQTPSSLGLSTAKAIEAQLCLAENDTAAARTAIAEAWHRIEEQNQLDATEGAAGIITLTGLLHALEGDTAAALSFFERANRLPPDLHNRIGQAWAWATRAIIAAHVGDSATSLAAIRGGLDLVLHCGAPARTFLLSLLRNTSSTPDMRTLKDIQQQVCGYL